MTRRQFLAAAGLVALGLGSDVLRRLLLGGAGGSFQAPTVASYTSPKAGGWTHASDPHAVRIGDVVVFGYVNMANGNIEVRSRDLVTDVTSAAFVLHAALDADIHCGPSFIERSDGRIVAVYSDHNGTTMYARISTNPADVSAWGSEASLDATLGGTGYTYPTLAYLGTDLCLFYRDHQVSDEDVLAYSVSSDGGATWSAQTALFESTGRAAYWKIDSDGSRIDIAVSDGRLPFDADPIKLFHFYMTASGRFQTDGTSIGASLPLTPAALTQVYDAALGMGWPMAVVAGTNPVIGYAVLPDGISSITNLWRYARWDGAAWQNATIGTSGGVIDSAFSGNFTIDPTAPQQVIAPFNVSGRWEMFQCLTGDLGATWTNTPLTVASARDQLYPVPVRNRDARARALWLDGPYTTYLDTDQGVVGWG